MLGACTGNPLLGSSGSTFNLNHTPFLISPNRFEILSASPGILEATLQWSSSKNASAYSVYYRISGASNFTLASDRAASPYVVSGLQNNTTYEFKVTAVNDHGSLDSSPVSITLSASPSVVPHHLIFAVQPIATTGLQAGALLSVQPKVQILSETDALTTANSIPIVLSLFSDSDCQVPVATTPNRSDSLSGSLSGNSASGELQFENVRVNLASQSLFLGATSAGLISACSRAFSINPGAYSLAESSVTASAASVASGDSISISLTAKDQFGNSNPSGLPSDSSILFTSSSVGGTGSFDRIDSSGSGFYTSSFTGVLAGSVILGASISGSLVLANDSVTVIPGAATRLSFSSVPASTPAGTAFDVTITALDGNGNTATSFANPVSFTSSDTQAILPSASSLTSGTGSFSVTLKTAGSITITAASTGITSASASVTVSAGAASRLTWDLDPAPASLTAGMVFTSQPQISVRDPYDNLLASASGTVRIAAYSDLNCEGSELKFGLGGGSTPMNVSKSLVNGVASFSSVSALSTSMKSIKAIFGSITSCTSGFNVAPGPLQGVATQVTFSQVPSTATAGTPIASGLSFEIHDAYHNKVSTSGTAQLALYDDAGCTVASPAFTNRYFLSSLLCNEASCNSLSMTSGTATVSSLTFRRSEPGWQQYRTGPLYLKVSSGNLTGDCSPAIPVTPGSVDNRLTPVRTSSTSVNVLASNHGGVGEAFLLEIQLSLEDHFGNYSTVGLPTSAHFYTVEGGGTFGQVANPAPGLYTVRYTPLALGINAWNIDLYIPFTDYVFPSFSVGPGSPASIAFSTPPAPLTLSAYSLSFSTQPVVTALDSLGNISSLDSSSQISLTAYNASNCSGSVINAGLGGTLIKPLSLGIATFSGLSIQNTTIRSIKASLGSITTCQSGISVVNSRAPVASTVSQGLSQAAMTLTLPYTDSEGDLATACSVISSGGLVVSSPCSCTSGVCRVGIMGSNGLNSATFTYTVTTADGLTSNIGTLNLSNSPPVLSNLAWAPTTPVTAIQALFTLPSATDPDGDTISSCSITDLSNVTISLPCECSNGVCQVGLTASALGTTSGSFKYSVFSNNLNSQEGTATVSISLPNLTFDPVARPYGSVTVGETGGGLSFTITNSGNGAASGCSAPTLSPSTHFRITSDTCGTANLAAGASCVVQVAASPTASGRQTTTLSRSCTNLFGETRTQSTTTNGIEVAGVASAPILTSYADSTVDFANVRVGSASAKKEIILTNSGFGTLTGCSAPTLSNSSDFMIVSDTCGTSNLSKGAACTVTVVAKPTVASRIDGTLNRACTQSSISVALSLSAFSGSVSALSSTLGANNSCVLISDGTIRCWGQGGNGVNGSGVTTDQPNSGAVSGINSATAVVMGYLHACALLSDQTVKCWGINDNLQAGGTSTVKSLSPVQIETSPGAPLTNVAVIAAGANHTCATLNSGSVYCWGQGSETAPVNGTTSPSTYALPISGITDAQPSSGALAGGDGFSCAVRTNGGVRCWGANGTFTKQLGNNTGVPSSVAVDVLASAGNVLTGASAIALSDSSACVRMGGVIKCWGTGGSGQIGNGSTTQQPYPTANGITSATSVVAASRGSSFCAVLSGAGGVKCWGLNRYGILGDGTETTRLSPVSVAGISNALQISMGENHVCALTSSSESPVKCWGLATSYRTGRGYPSVLIPSTGTLVSSLGPLRQVSSGGSSACALTTSGQVRCFGAGSNGQLGNGSQNNGYKSATTVNLGTGLTATSIAAGNSHYCALLGNSTIKCWGHGQFGTIGNNSTSGALIPQPVSGISNANQVGSGNYYSCALLSDKTVWCWGMNTRGQLGNAPAIPGPGVQSNVPVQVSGITTATQISVGYDHACALLQDRTVRCWGDNTNGQYGNDTGGSGVFGNIPQQADISGVIAISAGNKFTCALLNNSTVKCWGAGANGMLGNGVSINSQRTPDSVVSGEEGGAVLTRITAISSTQNSSCGIRKATGTTQLVCWGQNSFGQRGLGNINTSLYRRSYEVPGMTDITSISQAPTEHTFCAISSTGTPYCFGNNDSNQTGVDHMIIDSVQGL